LSTFYNKTDDDVNFFVIISSGFGGAEFPGSEVQRFRVQRFRGAEVPGSKVQRFRGSGFRGSEVERFRVQRRLWPRAFSQIEKKKLMNIEN